MRSSIAARQGQKSLNSGLRARSGAAALPLAAAVLALGMSGTEVAARDLTIVAYGGATQTAMREAYFKPYMAAKGANVAEDEGPTLAKIRAMVETGNVTWDIIDQESAEATVGCEEGLFERIDWSKFKTDTYLKGSLTDCGFGMYTAGNILAYDGDRFPEGPKSWADFWDVEKFPGKRGFWYTPKNTLEIALIADGVAPQEVYKELAAPGGIDRAFKKLDELKPHIVWWNAGAEFINRLASGEYAMTFAWNGRIDAANMTDKRNFKIAWEAGFTYVIDQWVIVKGTPNLDKAYDFLSFFDNKERQADWMTRIAYASTNLEAMELLTPERRAVMPLAPENVKYGVPVDDGFWAEHYDSLTERFNAWAGQAQ